ncbi:TrmH family RNA methyltransferase [Thermoflavifilum aggregans]|uniref:TrmH family RNA methyltransferase n=1 Tax=Thermoflavifilum aggregans TaxID=454188 RepID=A0A2M9CUA4_9BACT|nr:RNA methyltransferase [Thermoflavifilum aggregans]PJJ75496.1 TrmH family RNA methyltransferase [Thermoflavifilum aggregans]
MISKAQIKEIRLLHLKKHRQRYGCFVAEGDKTVCSFLESPWYQVLQIYALPAWVEARKTFLQSHRDVPVEIIKPDILAQISRLQTPQQVLALIHLPAQAALPSKPKGLTLALDAIRDPGNLGTIIRIADWFGIPYICCSPDCADAFQPKVVQASMGSLAHVHVVEQELASLFQQHRDMPVYAATLTGKAIQQFCKGTDTSQPAFLLIGNEAHGISRELLPLVTECITIPRLGNAESLNAAIATGILCGFLCLTENAKPAPDKSAG